MNEAARRILTALNGAGYEAYIVGGAVRDILMKRRPHDYDIVTSARPEEVAAVAAEQGWGYVDGKGLAFGVSRVITGGESFEVAAFRSEIYGTDSHRPERIRYASTLREDVQRRDFTVNALAMDKDGAVYDYKKEAPCRRRRPGRSFSRRRAAPLPPLPFCRTARFRDGQGDGLRYGKGLSARGRSFRRTGRRRDGASSRDACRL